MAVSEPIPDVAEGSSPSLTTKIKVMKIYLVNREDYSEYDFTTNLKVFSTLEKANLYVKELEEMYKDNVSFQFGKFSFEVVEMIVE